jgi:hypothetical protein
LIGVLEDEDVLAGAAEDDVADGFSFEAFELEFASELDKVTGVEDAPSGAGVTDAASLESVVVPLFCPPGRSPPASSACASRSFFQ